MKIALLNLPLDNNFGGNLQRYALVKVLQDMGHEVEHINLRFNVQVKTIPLLKNAARQLFRMIKYRKKSPLFPAISIKMKYNRSIVYAKKFQNRYIPHTKVFQSKEELRAINGYDVYVVGSDQVWRKKIAKPHGISTYFFDFLKDTSAPRVAYGVSFGTDENELTQEERSFLGALYKNFRAVSVRESSGLTLLNEYGWTQPEACFVLDPTMLLDKEDYRGLIKNTNTRKSEGNMFCYILDKSEIKDKLINNIASEKNLKPFLLSIDKDRPVAIEQWLRSFDDADMVVTDSFHGLLFSIIFNKPYVLLKNEFRGNARFDSVLKMFSLTSDERERRDWETVNLIRENMKKASFLFLKENIC